MMNRSPCRLRVRRRAGRGVLTILFVLALLAVVAAGGYAIYGPKTTEIVERPLTSPVVNGPFENVVLEQGEVESSSNIEIRCEVKSRNGGGVTIIEIVPEGTVVQQGDLLVRLDATALELEKVSQQIACNTSEALVIQAQNTFEAAQIARVEYIEGTFKKDEQLILSEIFVAEQNLRTSQLAYSSAERLSLRGIVTSLQLEGEKFAVDKARNELSGAQTRLEVLRKYTNEKMLKQLDSDIASAKAKWNAEQKSYELEMSKLKDIEDQVAKCTITAPRAGQVKYANKYSSSRGGSTAEFVVEPGAVVREQQPIIQLPNSAEMQVKATINESRVTFVKIGMPVAIRVDALREESLAGEVVRLNQYAEPGGWSSGNIKKYAAFVRIKDPPPTLRAGMNAEVRIFVERRPEVLQLPVQALVEHDDGAFYGLLETPTGYETRKLKNGSSNDKFMVVLEGAREGERFVLNPRSRKELQLPEVKEKPSVVTDAVIAPPAGTGGPAPTSFGDKSKSKSKSGRPSAAQMVNTTFTDFDLNKDDTLDAAEIAAIPEDRRARLGDADANKDGKIDRAELTASVAKFVAAMRERMQQGGGPPGENP